MQLKVQNTLLFTLLLLLVLSLMLCSCASEPTTSLTDKHLGKTGNKVQKSRQAPTSAVAPKAVKASPSKKASPAKKAEPIAQKPIDPPKQTASDINKRIQKHGENAVVRASNSLSKKKKKQKKYKLTKPVWDKPYPLSFHKLKRNYEYLVVNDEFYKDGLPRIHGGAVEISGAVMPIDTPGENGELFRFWLANPVVVMAGCVFCNPPTISDLVYVYVKDDPIKVDRETLYRSVLNVTIKGRFFIEAGKSEDEVEYLYSMELKDIR